ncbi:MAG: enoyl-CoA hydratase/isomerase family protein [Candidatus Magasanikbacteria bacterium]|nr:enoyl-CoA hydratase/isomerase family protein [Candidatus Magasanikbacteria bacterium]
MNIGIVGAGVIGADIAYVATGLAAKTGGKVLLVDVGQEQLGAAMGRIRGYVTKAVKKGKLSEGAAAKALAAITTTLNLSDLSQCDAVFEAASENVEVKQSIYAQLEKIVRDDCLILTTTSSIPWAVLTKKVLRHQRFFVWHPFTPAWRSLPVELVGHHVNWQRAYDLTVALGKVPIATADVPCFAADQIFTIYCLACAWLVERGVATVAQVNAIADKYIGGSGAFNVLNITAGNKIIRFCADMMREKYGDYWTAPPVLLQQGSQPWDLSGDKSCNEETERTIHDQLMAAIIGRAVWLVDNNVISATDLDWLCKNALGFKFGLVAQFNQDPNEIRTICAIYAQENPGFTVPESIVEAMSIDFFSNVKVEINDDGIVVVTIFRPEAMNALNRLTMVELDYAFRGLETDEKVRGIILTGYNGAIAGADINELAALTDPKQGTVMAISGQGIFNYIESLGKPVIAVVNGPCLGGGCELVMACHDRVVGKNAIIGQPEVNLGIIPGYGGTQRLPRLVGFAKALELLRTGKTINAGVAKEIGWARDLGSGDPMDSAKRFIAAHLKDPDPEIHATNPNPMGVSDGTPIVDIGHHSQAIDAILVDVVRRGLALPLAEGLKLEADGFGHCFGTQDMRIGLTNFMANGPKVPAVFMNS